METVTQFTMRMENDLYTRLKQSAEKNKRSIAKELEFIVESYLNFECDFDKRFREMVNYAMEYQRLKNLPPID